MLSKRYESTEVERRTWLHVPSGNSGPPAVTLTKWLKLSVRVRYIGSICHRLNVSEKNGEEARGKKRKVRFHASFGS